MDYNVVLIIVGCLVSGITGLLYGFYFKSNNKQTSAPFDLKKVSCKECRFSCGQDCRRHAPICPANEGNYTPRYPTIIDTWCHWCGDFEAINNLTEVK